MLSISTYPTSENENTKKKSENRKYAMITLRIPSLTLQTSVNCLAYPLTGTKLSFTINAPLLHMV